MPMYQVVQIDTETGRSTGRKVWFLAKNVKEVASNLLYYGKLKHKGCKLGPTGRVMANCGDGTSWVITWKKRERKKKR